MNPAGTEILTLTAYFAERERHGGRFLAEELLDRYDQRSIATSVMLRGIASFGPAHVATRAADPGLSAGELERRRARREAAQRRAGPARMVGRRCVRQGRRVMPERRVLLARESRR